MNLKQVLKGKLSASEMKNLKTSFDIVGDVAILEIPEELEPKEKEIAEGLLKVNRHVKTVVKKSGSREGEFRLRDMKIVLGSGTETTHKESGCVFRLDVTKAYFSPREGTERLRVSEQVRPKETVMVMFAGVGPYAVVIGKKQPEVKKIYAVEINKNAFDYMKENIRLNKLEGKVEPVLGDVAEKCGKYYGKCDRVLMPLPKGGYQYLLVAIKCLKPKGFIHFYYWSHEKDLFSDALKFLKEAAEKSGRKIRILSKRKVLPYGPRVWKICIDAKIYKT
jgi:tRNA (guanine37-N1)-methyltransferase